MSRASPNLKRPQSGRSATSRNEALGVESGLSSGGPVAEEAPKVIRTTPLILVGSTNVRKNIDNGGGRLPDWIVYKINGIPGHVSLMAAI